MKEFDLVDFSGKYDEELFREVGSRALNLDGSLEKITPELIEEDDELNAQSEVFIDPIKRTHPTDEEIKEAFGGFWDE